MATIPPLLVKELRDRTGLGMMDCKKALVDAEGNIDQAIETLRKSSGMKAAKKAGRTASEGLVSIRKSDDGQITVLVEINCETDFAARDENFKSFVGRVTELVLGAEQVDLEKLLAEGLEAEREALVQKIGENISVRRAVRYNSDGKQLGSYVHTNGKIGVMVELEGGNEELGKDIAMHVAATNPMVITPDQLPAEEVAKEREIYVAQAEDSGKPPEIVEKMVEGRIHKYLAEVSLVEQPFVKDPDLKVGGLLKAANATVNRFVRYEVGEGIEVEKADFAAEVAAQLQGN
ncbi:MAG: translation elongation factor Ts [Gammaproteobacteria bacterium]|nr:translation elongation factor Ts [Gammaproteobacteria bacterium]